MKHRRASYRDAVDWIAANDDTEWLNDDAPIPSVTASLVADVFDRTAEELQADLHRALRSLKRRKYYAEVFADEPEGWE